MSLDKHTGTFRREQSPLQTVTITTRGITDIQFAKGSHNEQPLHFPKQGSPDEAEERAAPNASAPTRNKPHKTPQARLDNPAPSKPGHSQNRPTAPQDTGPPNHNAPAAQNHGHPQSALQSFVCSKCTGKKKAVGINYKGSSNPLDGCVNDARNIRDFLIKGWNFKSQDIMLLTDDSRDPNKLPTKANMLNAMKWLLKDAKAHDSLFFHYSGHGGRMPEQASDEVDGYDDVIFPLDHQQKGVGIINDNTLNELLVHTVPTGCRLTALFDSCHSSSVLDLVYLESKTGNGTLKNSPVSEEYRKQKSSQGDVICFSGCEDNQTSADTVQGGLAVGAMSYAFIKCLNEKPKQSYQELLKNVRAFLRKQFSQRPQLSSSHEIDIGTRFIL